jgi:hypothetical protein
MLRHVTAIVMAVAAQASAAAAASAPAASASAVGVSQRSIAVAACERAVQTTLRETRGASAAPTFNTAPSVVPGAADAPEITLRGAGQVRIGAGVRPFSFSCSFDIASASVAGVVVRDSAAAPTATAARAVEPDLSHVSPTACESAAAAALKRRWPGVMQINFNPDTRQLSQDADGVASLRGQGSATPTVRDPEVHFSYDCAIDARNGRVMRVAIGN